ncbi:tetratricopeptide repeat protein [Longivirga aurantiaca]|uniref:Tetratricopeptide repeat protein 38 n=1 Tax=Longivirga aurantiaca TaxID=1837743 RepID=A0ABW1T0H1_9ACTN
MSIDQHGNVLTDADPAAVAAYDDAVDHLLHFRSEVGDSLSTALTIEPGLAMGRVMEAYLGVLGTEPDDVAAAKESLTSYIATTDASGLQPRERQHLAAADALVRGDLVSGGRLLRALVVEHPRDALALAVGHQVDFFTADAPALRDRVGGALSAWTEDDPHLGQLLGMHAFGLEECGLYGRSEDVGLRALELDRSDVWALHAVAHTFEMQGRFAEGRAFLDERAGDWQQGNFLNVHNWWHYCLYLLEAGDTRRPLEIYDAVLHHAESAGLAMEMLDASALLWRLLLEGEDTGSRWTALAEAWDAKVAVPLYSFNDMHAVMAYIGAGRLRDAERLVESRTQWLAGDVDPAVTNVTMTREVGLPVARALVAFAREDYATAVELLAPIRSRVQLFGGSHAQRDAVQRTLLEAAIRAGRLDLARTLVSERLGINPCSPYSWLKRATVVQALGDEVGADLARAEAEALRTAR